MQSQPSLTLPIPNSSQNQNIKTFPISRFSNSCHTLFTYLPSKHSFSIHQIQPSQIQSLSQMKLYTKILQTLVGYKHNKKGQNIDNSYIKNTQMLQSYRQQMGNRLDEVLKVIIHHCDEQNITKNIHKLLYLTIKYISVRVSRQKKRNNKKYIKSYRTTQLPIDNEQYDYLQWLTDASRLYSQQLQQPPIQGYTSNQYIQPSKRNIKKLAQKYKIPKLSSVNQTPQSIFLSTLKFNYHQLYKSNPYFYLLSLLQSYQLQKLQTNLQYLISNTFQIFNNTNNENDEITKKGNYLIKIMKSIIQILLKRIYLQKCINQKNHPQPPKQPSQKPINLQYKIDLNQYKNIQEINTYLNLSNQPKSTLDKFIDKQPMPNSNISSTYKQQIQNYNNLSIILKYLLSILLGNQQSIQAYSGNNIYLYLKLSIIYSQSISPQSIQHPNYKQLTTKYLLTHNSHSSFIKSQSVIQLLQQHNYLLDLLNYRQQISSDKNSNFHKIYQNSLKIFYGYQFYAYLFGTLMFYFNLSGIYIYQFDQQYSDNIIRQLIFSTTFNVKLSNQLDKSTNKTEKNNQQYFVIDDNQQQLYPHHHQKQQSYSFSNSYDNPDTISKQVHPKQLQNKNNIPFNDTQITRTKLLFLIIGLYKLIYKTTKQHQIKLFNLLQQSKASNFHQHSHSYSNTHFQQPELPTFHSNIPSPYFYKEVQVPYSTLPFHQLLLNIIFVALPYTPINSYQSINSINMIAKYVCEINSYDYFSQYLITLIKLNLKSDVLGVTTAPIDKFGLQLMVLQIKTAIWGCQNLQLQNSIHNKRPTGHDDNKYSTMFMQQQIYDFTNQQPLPTFGQNNQRSHSHQQHPHYPYQQYEPYYNTYSFYLLSFGYLTKCTLESPFDYQMLGKIKELTGVNSELKKISRNAAADFVSYWEVYFVLEKITQRGKYTCSTTPSQLSSQHKKKSQSREINPQQQANQQSDHNINNTINGSSVKLVSSTRNTHKLKKTLHRIQSMINLLSRNDMQGCGQVLRVAWQVLQDYQNLKQQLMKQITHSSEEDDILDRTGDKLVTLVSQLKDYIMMMEQQGYYTEELKQFKNFLF